MEYSNIYIIEATRSVEVIGFDIRKIPNYTQDLPFNHRLEPVIGELYRLMVAIRVGISELPNFLLEDHWFPQVELQIRPESQRPQFVLQRLILQASIVLDAHNVCMLNVISQPRHKNWPAIAHFTVRTRPLSTAIMSPPSGNHETSSSTILGIWHSTCWFITLWARSSDAEIHQNLGRTGKQAHTMSTW